MIGYLAAIAAAILFGAGWSRIGIQAVFGTLIKTAKQTTLTIRSTDVSDDEKEAASRHAAVSIGKNLLSLWLRLIIILMISSIPLLIIYFSELLTSSELSALMLDPVVLVLSALAAVVTVRMTSS